MSLTDGLNGLIGDVKQAISNPITSAIGGAVIGSAVTGTIIAATRKSTKRRKKTSKSRKTSRKKKKRSYKYARTAGKRKDTSRKRIRMTKNGQPYVIMANGRARFIKKSSARQSRKRKGGRY